jgi:hypothetical protein
MDFGQLLEGWVDMLPNEMGKAMVEVWGNSKDSVLDMMS